MEIWLGGYDSELSAAVVDDETWADSARLGDVLSASVSRDRTGDVPLLESGTVEVDSGEVAGPTWLRLYLTARGASVERAAVATLLFERESRRSELGGTAVLKGRSSLAPAADADLVKAVGRGFAEAGEDGAAWAARAIAACTPAPVAVEGSFALSSSLNFAPGCKCLDAAWSVLSSAGWCMQTDGLGAVAVRPMPSSPALALDRARAGLLVPGVDDDFSVSGVPNRYTARLGGEEAVAVNDDPDSEAGFPQRGRWVDADLDDSPVLVDGETLELYARRRLAEVSRVARTFSYQREFYPGVTVFDIVSASLPGNGLEGELRVATQSIDLSGGGALVSETAEMEVSA